NFLRWFPLKVEIWDSSCLFCSFKSRFPLGLEPPGSAAVGRARSENNPPLEQAHSTNSSRLFLTGCIHSPIFLVPPQGTASLPTLPTFLPTRYCRKGSICLQ